MSDGFSVKVNGLHELNAALKAIETKTAKKVVRDAVRKGAKLYRDDAKRRVPTELDTLRKSIIMRVRQRVSRSQNATVTEARVGPTKGSGAKHDAWYAHLFEWGVDPHEITVSGARVLADKEDEAGGIFGTRVFNEGIPKHLFMTRAAVTMRRPSVRVLREDVRKSLRVIWAGRTKKV